MTQNIFVSYAREDANSENNHSSQAPITPFIPGAKPDSYISHNSNILLGNATKGKVSSRYYRTLRNGKETDF